MSEPGRQRAAAVAADRDDRHPLRRRRVVRPVHMGGGEIVEGADDLVHQMRKPRGAGGAAAVLHQHALGRRTAGGQPLLQYPDDAGADLLAVAVALRRFGQRRQIAAQARQRR